MYCDVFSNNIYNEKKIKEDGKKRVTLCFWFCVCTAFKNSHMSYMSN
jgi:hypothetical protein